MKEFVMEMFTILGGITAALGLATLLLKSYNTWVWKRRFNWDKALRAAENLLEEIERSNWNPQAVVGIGRSGGIWGGWMAGNLGSLPFYVIDNVYNLDDEFSVSFPDADVILEALKNTHPEKKNVLIITGGNSSGSTFKKLKEILDLQESLSFKYAVLYQNPTAKFKVDYIGELGPTVWPKKFPWHMRKAYKPYLRDIFE